MCSCGRSGRGASIRLLTLLVPSYYWSRRTVRFVKLALKVGMQNDGDFVDVMLLYVGWECRGNSGPVCIILFAHDFYLTFANEDYLNRIATRAVLFAILSVILSKWLLLEKLIVIHLLLWNRRISIALTLACHGTHPEPDESSSPSHPDFKDLF